MRREGMFFVEKDMSGERNTFGVWRVKCIFGGWFSSLLGHLKETFFSLSWGEGGRGWLGKKRGGIKREERGWFPWGGAAAEWRGWSSLFIDFRSALVARTCIRGFDALFVPPQRFSFPSTLGPSFFLRVTGSWNFPRNFSTFYTLSAVELGPFNLIVVNAGKRDATVEILIFQDD